MNITRTASKATCLTIITYVYTCCLPSRAQTQAQGICKDKTTSTRIQVSDGAVPLSRLYLTTVSRYRLILIPIFRTPHPILSRSIELPSPHPSPRPFITFGTKQRPRAAATSRRVAQCSAACSLPSPVGRTFRRCLRGLAVVDGYSYPSTLPCPCVPCAQELGSWMAIASRSAPTPWFAAPCSLLRVLSFGRPLELALSFPPLLRFPASSSGNTYCKTHHRHPFMVMIYG